MCVKSLSVNGYKRAGDITRLWTDEGRLSLAMVQDLRRIVGWVMSERMTAQQVCDALLMAAERCQKPRWVIVHRDRGRHYWFTHPR